MNHASSLSRLLQSVRQGFDYHYDNSHPGYSERGFKKHLLLAKDFELPVIIHNRKAKKGYACKYSEIRG